MLPLVLLAQVSCKIYDDEDSLQEPAYMVVQQTYMAYVDDLFRMVELADFYRSYREIWQDREASMQLADSYFPEGRVSEDGLYYEMADVSGWGVIKAGNDGTYTIKSYGDYSCYVFRNYYGYESMNYEVTVSADGYFSIKSVDPEDNAGNDSILKIEAKARCADGNVVIEECNIVSDFCNIVSVADKPLVRKRVTPSGTAYNADSGSLSYSYSDKSGVNDAFVLGFHADHVSIERGSSVVKCLLLNEVERSVDYVISD